MTVKELIEKLDKMDGDLVVVVNDEDSYGDSFYQEASEPEEITVVPMTRRPRAFSYAPLGTLKIVCIS